MVFLGKYGEHICQFTYRYIASKRKEEIYSSSRIEGTNVN